MRLTVAIPTYNRANLLLILLQEVSQQIRQLIDFEVEILVSDNASTDNTTEVVKSFKDRNQDIQTKYHINKCNLGYDKNVDLLFHLASGDYVMTISDDDGLEHNALSLIRETLENHSVAKVIYVASSFYDYNLEEKISINDPFFENVGVSRYFSSARELFISSQEVFGGISGLCIERKSWVAIDATKYYGTNWIQLGVTLSILAHSDVYVITDKLLKYRLNNKDSRWGLLETSLGIQYVLLEFSKIFPDVIKGIYNEHRHQTRLSLIHFDSSERFVDKSKILSKMLIAFDKRKLSFWLVDLPLLYFPQNLLKVAYRIYQSLKKYI